MKVDCKLPTVDRFLCCLTLESGGFYMGWGSAIFSGIGIITVFSLFILSAITFNIGEIKIFYNCETEIARFSLFSVLSVIYVIFILYFGVVLYASIELIRGTRNVNEFCFVKNGFERIF